MFKSKRDQDHKATTMTMTTSTTARPSKKTESPASKRRDFRLELINNLAREKFGSPTTWASRPRPKSSLSVRSGSSRAVEKNFNENKVPFDFFFFLSFSKDQNFESALVTNFVSSSFDILNLIEHFVMVCWIISLVNERAWDRAPLSSFLFIGRVQVVLIRLSET